MNPGDPTNSALAQATVLKLWDTGITLNDDPQVGVLLQVQFPDQPSYRLETKVIVPRHQVAQMQLGAVFAVRVALGDPTRIVLLLDERG